MSEVEEVEGGGLGDSEETEGRGVGLVELEELDLRTCTEDGVESEDEEASLFRHNTWNTTPRINKREKVTFIFFFLHMFHKLLIIYQLLSKNTVKTHHHCYHEHTHNPTARNTHYRTKRVSIRRSK